MSFEWWVLIAIVALFLIIIGCRLFVVIKNKAKQPKEKKEKPKKEKKQKAPKEEKQEKTKEVKEKKAKTAFQRPMQMARARLKEKQEAEALRKAQEAEELAKNPPLSEGETNNINYAENQNKTDSKTTPSAKTDNKEQTLSEELKNLSPEMKALLLGDVLDKKTK